MTEQEWLGKELRLDLMLDYLEGRLSHWKKPDTAPNASDRKMRLFACSCCRRVWELLDVESRRVVQAAEACADGLIATGELDSLADSAVDRADKSLETTVQHRPPTDD
jgi:hypothetical protein